MDLFSLSGKVVVITGAAGLLGRNHALAVAAAGGTPVLLDIDINRLSMVADEVSKTHGVKAAFFKVDITDEAQIKACCETVLNEFRHIDESAGVNEESRLENFSLKNWNADVAVGLSGSFLCTKYFGTAIAKQGGSIVNISSDLGVIAPDQRLYEKPGVEAARQPVKPVTYSVIKSGLIGLTRYTSTYWANQGVRCNALCPGGIENAQDEAFVVKLSIREA